MTLRVENKIDGFKIGSILSNEELLKTVGGCCWGDSDDEEEESYKKSKTKKNKTPTSSQTSINGPQADANGLAQAPNSVRNLTNGQQPSISSTGEESPLLAKAPSTGNLYGATETSMASGSSTTLPLPSSNSLPLSSASVSASSASSEQVTVTLPKNVAESLATLLSASKTPTTPAVVSTTSVIRTTEQIQHTVLTSPSASAFSSFSAAALNGAKSPLTPNDFNEAQKMTLKIDF